MTKNILVCLDGTEISERILPYATEQAIHFHGKLILLKVCPSVAVAATSVGPGQSLMFSPVAVDMAARGDLAQARLYLSRKARELAEKGVEVEVATVPGAFADSIIQFIRENAIDLVAMTAHAYKGWKRLLHGSALEEVLRESHVPVLVINPAGPEPA